MYSPRVDEALAFTASAFRNIDRKGSGIPYLTHLLQVATWVMEHGGTEDQFIAALLHDYLEDIPEGTSQALESRFGSTVARYVEALSDTTTHPKPPWQERKTAYLARLKLEPPEVKLISCSDKLHNATSILRDLDLIGDKLWDRFNASKEQSHWYYGEVVKALGHEWTHPLLDRLTITVNEIKDRG